MRLMIARAGPVAGAGRHPAEQPEEVLYHPACVPSNMRTLAIAAVVIGLLAVVAAVIYFAEPAHSLPSFFPGHVSASSSEAAHHHTKHGIAALVVAVACFAFAWFATGPKAGSAPSAT
jgi:hypothetical protein